MPRGQGKGVVSTVGLEGNFHVVRHVLFAIAHIHPAGYAHHFDGQVKGGMQVAFLHRARILHFQGKLQFPTHRAGGHNVRPISLNKGSNVAFRRVLQHRVQIIVEIILEDIIPVLHQITQDAGTQITHTGDVLDAPHGIPRLRIGRLIA